MVPNACFSKVDYIFEMAFSRHYDAVDPWNFANKLETTYILRKLERKTFCKKSTLFKGSTPVNHYAFGGILGNSPLIRMHIGHVLGSYGVIY